MGVIWDEYMLIVWVARAQVHWVSVTSKWPNHDAICEVKSADQLTENALVKDKELHSSKGSIGTGITLNHMGKAALGGIEESTEDPATPKQDLIEFTKPIALEFPKSVVAEEPPSIIPESLLSFPAPPRLELPADHTDAGAIQETRQPEGSPRLSSTSPRPPTADFFGASLDFSSLDKPKARLAPRPTNDKRQHPSTRKSTDTRPTASLPTGLRAQRPTSHMPPPALLNNRPTSRGSTMTMSRLPPPPPIPETTIYIPSPRPKSSAGSVKSLPATLPKSTGNSKERQRLMKFREMYKQKEKAKGKVPPVPPLPVLPASPIPEETVHVPSIPAVSSLEKQENLQLPEELQFDKKFEAEEDLHSQPETVISKAPSLSSQPPPPTPEEPAEQEAATPEVVTVESSHIELPTDTLAGADSTSEEKQVDSESRTGLNNDPNPIVEDTTTSILATNIDSDTKVVPEMASEITTQHASMPSKSETPTMEETSFPPSQSSPTSVQESLEPMSTRPTSVSEVSEKIIPESSGRQSPRMSDVAGDLETISLTNDDKQTDTEDSPTETSQTTPTPQTPAVPSIQTQHSDSPEVKTTNLSSLIIAEAVTKPRPVSVSSNTSVDHLIVALPPIGRAMSASSMEDDDDEFELSKAEVHEATPVAVSARSPLATFFSRKGSLSGFRAFSAPHSDSKIESVKVVTTPASPKARLRSISGGALSTPRSSDANEVNVAKTRVQGGIAAKIADLQRRVSRTGPMNSSPPSTATSTPSKMVHHRASALEIPLGDTSSLPRRMSSLKPPSRGATPPRDEPKQAHDVSSLRHIALATKKSPKVLSPIPDRSMETPTMQRKRDSITVRTPIIRSDPIAISTRDHDDEEDESPTSAVRGLGLNLSNLLSNSTPESASHHQRTHSSATFRLSRTSRSPLHPSARSSSVSSLRSHPSSPTPDTRSPDLFGFRRSIDGWRSRRQSLSSKSPPIASSALPRSMSNSSLDTAASSEDFKGDAGSLKKPNRASRLLKRMSSSIGAVASGGRGTLQTLSEKAGIGELRMEKVESVKPPRIEVGDLNVQFPDTLVSSHVIKSGHMLIVLKLWKRRWIEIDDLGYLVLKPSNNNEVCIVDNTACITNKNRTLTA